MGKHAVDLLGAATAYRLWANDLVTTDQQIDFVVGFASVSPGSTLFRYLEENNLDLAANRSRLRIIIRIWLVNTATLFATFTDLEPILKLIPDRKAFIQLAEKQTVSPIQQIGVRDDFTVYSYHASESDKISFLESFEAPGPGFLKLCHGWRDIMLPSDLVILEDYELGKRACEEMSTMQHSRNTTASEFNLAEISTRGKNWLEACQYDNIHVFDC